MERYVVRDELVLEELDGGLVVYDPRSDEAHWLEPGSADVFRACAAGEAPRDVRRLAGASLSLRELISRGLVDDVPDGDVSRRAMLRTTAKVTVAGAVAAPILTVVVPAAAAHASTPGTGGTPPPPQQFSVTLQSGPGADGATDSNNLVSIDSGSTYVNAVVYSVSSYTVLSGTAYITSPLNGYASQFSFKPTDSIFIPAGATGATISGQFYSDNQGLVYVNGTLVASNSPGDTNGPGQFQPPVTNFAAPLVAGQANTVVFVVNNPGGPGGLDFMATYSYMA